MKKLSFLVFAMLAAFAEIHSMQLLTDGTQLVAPVVGIASAAKLVQVSEQGVLTHTRHALTTLGLCAITEGVAQAINLDTYVNLSLVAAVALGYGVVRPLLRKSALENAQFLSMFHSNYTKKRQVDILWGTITALDLIDCYKNDPKGLLTQEIKEQKIKKTYDNYIWKGFSGQPGLSKLFANKKTALRELRKMDADFAKIKDEKERLRSFLSLKSDELFEDYADIISRLTKLVEEQESLA